MIIICLLLFCRNFLFTFDAPPSLVEKIHQEYVRDIDIVKSQIFQKQFPDEFDCQLDEETRPAPYRFVCYIISYNLTTFAK